MTNCSKQTPSDTENHVWTGSLIRANSTDGSAPRLRKHFGLEAGHGLITSAHLVVSALGLVEAYLNGNRVSEDVLFPGWTSYEWRVRYLEVDVTDLLSEQNVIALQLGNGWYVGPMFITPGPAYGTAPAGFAELSINYEDGYEQIVGSDETWESGPSPTLKNSIYGGQTIDARREDRDWLQPNFTARDWTHAIDSRVDTSILHRQLSTPIRRQQTIAPALITQSESGKLQIDFGQNLVGWLKLKLQGPRDTLVTVRHAEVLEDRELGIRPLRSAEATDRYILSGGQDVFEPTFTFHGFRYADIEGWPGGIDTAREPGAIEAIVIGSELRRTGSFTSSDSLLNRFHENVVWSTRGNFVGIPTDCPQRDERLGWTGDIAVFASTASYLYDTESFLSDWMRDLVLEQTAADGIVPYVVPDVLKHYEMPPEFPPQDSTAIWGDAVAWVPWAVWQASGNSRILSENYNAMLHHCRRVESKLAEDGVWDSGFQWGDWLDPDAPPENALLAKTDPYLVATAAFYRTLIITIKTARILGRSEDTDLIALAGTVRAGFRSRFVDLDTMRIVSDSTTAYTLAIVFGLLDDEDATWAGNRLAQLVQKSDHHISTGFAGTPYICDALSQTGHLDEAYSLLLQTSCPSWLYPVTMGATTVWERWDSMLPDGSINSGEMTSFNHYALGAVADWIHRTVIGIMPDTPGYKTIRIAPKPGGGLSWAEGTLESASGFIRSKWEIIDGELVFDITIPPETNGVLEAPCGQRWKLGPGEHRRVVPFS